MPKPIKHRAPLVIGWREFIDLPGLGLFDLPAKIDTGARTTALHARKLRRFQRDGVDWVSFLPPKQKGTSPVAVELPIHDERAITNTGGVPDKRIIVRSPMRIGGRRFLIEISLANRRGMTFPVIVGRTAIRGHGILVDSGRSYLTNPSQTHAHKTT
jgi:hypothetical protein